MYVVLTLYLCSVLLKTRDWVFVYGIDTKVCLISLLLVMLLFINVGRGRFVVCFIEQSVRQLRYPFSIKSSFIMLIFLL